MDIMLSQPNVIPHKANDYLDEPNQNQPKSSTNYLKKFQRKD